MGSLGVTTTAPAGGLPPLPREARGSPYLGLGVGISLVVHIWLTLLLLRARDPEVPQLPAFEVTLLPPLVEAPRVEPRRQMVSPPDRTLSESPSQDARFLSERDATTPREQIRRGDGLEAGPTLGKQAPAAPPAVRNPAAPQPKPDRPAPQTAPKPNPRARAAEPVQPKAVSPREPERPTRLSPQALMLDQGTLLSKFGRQPRAREANPLTAAGPAQSLTNYQAFSRPQGSGAAFIGTRGSSDYLPHLPDGDITLLNTKADKFAVFVRRVATQVFAQLRASGWERLNSQDLLSIQNFTEVRASLSPEGKLLNVVLVGRGGSIRFDEVVIAAARRGANDPNPPVGARAADGNIHFIFKARSWGRLASNPQSGTPFERRWLLLGTGLE